MSILLDRVVEELSRLPGIGERTALRLALHILKDQQINIDRLTSSISDFRHNVKHCKSCNSISDNDLCPVCLDPQRDRSIICVVEQVKDVLSIEHTGQYNGLYHVLGGIISPMQGIAPSDLKVDLLLDKVALGDVMEVIIALNTTIEGETTSYYLSRKLKDLNIKISTIARGIGFGDELDYADDITLVHAIYNRREIG